MTSSIDRKAIRRLEKAADVIEAEDALVLKQLMSTMAGRGWLWRKLESCRIFSDPFTGDALSEAFYKGQRNVGLAIFTDILKHSPDEYILAARESNERNAAAERNRSKDTDGGVEGSGGSADDDRDETSGDYDILDHALRHDDSRGQTN